MTSYRRVVGVVVLLLGLPPASFGDTPLALLSIRPETKLPHTGLMPAKIMPGLCLVKYRVSTRSPECQAFFDQGLGFYYSYVWMEAARSFETATRCDPECAMAWWGLSRALEKWGKGKQADALKKAQDLLAKAGPCEKMLITARLQEKGMVALPAAKTGTTLTPAEARVRAACQTLDELLAQYDDEEAWFFRAQLSGPTACVPYYKALYRFNPLHPGANHELVHIYERIRRPALGWVHAEKYIESSPGLPHAFHMQAHLATRLGRWDKTSDRSARAIELQHAYHKTMSVKPSEDWQYSHHLEILTLSLVHDGRFLEARAVKQQAVSDGVRLWLPWFRLHLAERDWDAARKVIDHYRKNDKLTASYLSALLYLKSGDLGRAQAEVEVLQQAYQKNKNDRTLETRLLETQGMLMCRTGGADAGLKLLARIVDRTMNDYSHHAWGNGAYYMEAWGASALYAGKLDVAEEAFLEALAHDPGSVRAALGMQVLCEQLGRAEEASRFGDLARRCWRRAEVHHFDTELATLRTNVPQRTQSSQRDQETGAQP